MPQPPTERWSDQSLTWEATTWNATRAFDVVFNPGEKPDILAAELAVTGINAGINAPHPNNPYLLVRRLQGKRIGFSVIRVYAEYQIPTGGGLHKGQLNPLKEPPRIKWELGITSVPKDTDFHGNPILNAVGDPYDKDPRVDIGTFHLIYTRNEPFFDVVKAIKYLNAVNSDDWTIAGAGIVPAGVACCRGIQPVGEFTLNARFVAVQYSFEFRPDFDSQNKAQGWALRLMENGYRAYASLNQGETTFKGFLAGPDGAKIAKPAPLNSKGQPIDKTLKVLYGDYGQLLKPLPSMANLAQPGPVYDDLTDATFARWQVRAELSFTSLKLF